jgi:hypothetical protein
MFLSLPPPPSPRLIRGNWERIERGLVVVLLVVAVLARGNWERIERVVELKH